MFPRHLLPLLACVLALVAQPLATSAAAPATVPTITAVRGKVVYVKVPPGYRAITLQQRTGLKARPWKVLAAKQTESAGGAFSFLLKTAVAPRALFIVGERATAEATATSAGLTAFAADPSLTLSGGFSPADGARSGLVTLSSSSVSASNVSLSLDTASTPAREVSESDIWRVSGDRLYFFNELRGLQVFDVSNPDDPALLGQLREPNHGEQMYLLGSTHVALLTRPSYFFSLSTDHFAGKSSAAPTGSGAVVIADVSAGRPVEAARLAYPGYLVESRLVGSVLYVVSQVSDATSNGLQVTSYDLRNPAKPRQVATLALGSYGGVISATDRFLFVVRYSADWTRSTISVIDISDPKGALKLRGKMTIAGVVNDKFKMHLAGDILTVVSAVPRNWSGDRNDPENASRTVIENFSLARPQTPKRLGSLTVGTGETVRATRFADDRLYVVTFFTIDPLWVIDLSQPAQPTLLGELEVPGFSTYLEPLGDRLVAIGRIGAQTAVSLFDIADPAHPQLLSQLPLGDGSSYSEANWDEKAFTVLPEENLILVPFSGYNRSSGWASRVQLLDLTRDAIVPRGLIEQGLAARRTAVVNGRILAISATDLVTVNFTDRDHPAVTSEVAIAWRVDRVFLAGNHLVQLGGGAGSHSSEPPTVSVSTAADPDTILSVLDLENIPVAGATVRAGRLCIAQQQNNWWGPIYAVDGTTTDAGNSLIVSVFDLSNLPAITLLGRTQAAVEPGYGGTQLEAAWPDNDTLVWVRPQWISWWWGAPLDIALKVDIALPTINLLSAGTATVRTVDIAVAEPTTLAVAPAATTTSASSSMMMNALRWIPPWYRTTSGQEMIVFDLSDPAAPKFATQLTVRTGQTGDWSAPIARDGKLYLSSLAYDQPGPLAEGQISRMFRHFMKTVDFADPAHPTVSPEINIPGRLLAVDGATLLTVGCGFDTDGQPTGHRAFHTSRFDGTTAQLADQLETPSPYDPYALDGTTLILGTWSTGPGHPGQIQAWQIDGDGKFTLAGRVNAPTFTSLSTVRGLAIGLGAGAPRLFDVSDPTALVDLPDADTRELAGGDLSRADGGAGRGLWQPLGDYGVGVVRVAP